MFGPWFNRSILSLAFRLLRFRALLLLFLVLGTFAEAQAQTLERYEFSRGQMGTTFNIVLYSPDSSVARTAAHAAFARIDSLNRILSDYLVDSELNRLSETSGTGKSVAVSKHLWTVLSAAQRMAAQSDGAFDVTVGALTRLWRWAMRRDRLPPPEKLASALNVTGYRHVELDSLTRSVCLRNAGMRLDLGGIAKGYAVDEALAVIRSNGITRALVDGGGDIRVGAAPPNKSGWKIAVNHINEEGQPHQEARFLRDSAIATSGATYRHIEVDGVTYSHILDPKTGLGVSGQRLVTVVADSGMKADALASALSVLGLDAGMALVEQNPTSAARIIEKRNDINYQRDSASFEARFTSTY